MNIERNTALQKFRCCGAAKHQMHSTGKVRLTFQHSLPCRGQGTPSARWKLGKYLVKSCDCRNSETAVHGIAAQKEVAQAQDAMLSGKMGACAAHLSKAMHVGT